MNLLKAGVGGFYIISNTPSQNIPTEFCRSHTVLTTYLSVVVISTLKCMNFYLQGKHTCSFMKTLVPGETCGCFSAEDSSDTRVWILSSVLTGVLAGVLDGVLTAGVVLLGVLLEDTSAADDTGTDWSTLSSVTQVYNCLIIREVECLQPRQKHNILSTIKSCNE